MSKLLIGKVLTGIRIADDKGSLILATKDGEYAAEAYGDCCSTTWIESIELPALGLPAKILSIEELPMSVGSEEEEKENEYGSCIKFYGCKISTDKGDIIIDYRNESNGYYGGSLIWPGNDD